MIEDVEIRISDQIASSIAKKLAEIKTNAKAADNEVDRLKATLASVSASNSFRKDASEAEKLKNTLRSASQVSVSYYGQVSKLNTAIDHQGRSFYNATNQIRANTRALNENASQARASNGSLQQLASLLGTYAGIHAFVELNDSAQRFNNQLRTITDSQQEFNQLQDDLFSLANRTRTGIEATTQLYVNFYKVLKSVGIGQEELFRMVETLNKGFQVAGKTAQEATGSTRQFIQALQSGVLRGEEFNSIMEGMPIEILNSLASAAGVGIEKLRAMAEQGKLTRDVLRTALGNAANEIDRLFARTTPTINNAFTLLRNNAIEFFTESTGAGRLLAEVIMLIADNLSVVIPLVGLFAAAWATLALVKLVTDMWSLAKALGVVLLTTAPITASVLLWTAAIVGLILGIALLGDIIAKTLGVQDNYRKFLADSVKSIFALGDTIKKSLGSTAQSAIGTTTDSIKKLTTTMNPAVPEAAKAADDALNDFGDTASDAFTQASASVVRLTSNVQQLTMALRTAAVAAQSLNELRSSAAANPGFVGDPSLPSFTDLPRPAAGAPQAGYATGGEFIVGGQAGRDRNPVSFMATKGEKVSIQTKAQQRAEANAGRYASAGSTVVNFNVYANDADSFRRSRRQVAEDFKRIVQ